MGNGAFNGKGTEAGTRAHGAVRGIEVQVMPTRGTDRLALQNGGLAMRTDTRLADGRTQDASG